MPLFKEGQTVYAASTKYGKLEIGSAVILVVKPKTYLLQKGYVSHPRHSDAEREWSANKSIALQKLSKKLADNAFALMDKIEGNKKHQAEVENMLALLKMEEESND